MERWFFEDFAPGQTLPQSDLVVDEAEAAWFAGRFGRPGIDPRIPGDLAREGDGLDHDAFGWKSSKGMNVIESDMIEHDVVTKPVPTFRHPALAGWHVAALGMRLIYEAFLGRTASLGSPGIEELEWPLPVFAGDRLRFVGHVSSLRPSRSRPEMGLVGFVITLFNQRDCCVMRQSNVILVQRRTQGAET